MRNFSPDDTTPVELDIENMTYMTPFEFSHHLPSLQIPHLHRPIIAPTHQPTTLGIKGQRTNQHIVTNESPETFTSGGRPNLHLAIVRARNNDIILKGEPKLTVNR